MFRLTKSLTRLCLLSLSASALVVLLGAFVDAAPPSSALTFRQLTNTMDPYPLGCEYPALSASGEIVAFASNLDLIPGQNSDRNSEIFVMRTDGSDLRQVTSSNSGHHSANASLDAAGHKVAFYSFSDLVPGENTDHHCEIFLANTDGTELVQVTHSKVGGRYLANHLPSLNYSGRKIAFTSLADFLPGTKTQIFLVNADGSDLTQLTDDTSGESGDASLDPGGQRVVFVSTWDWVSGQPDPANARALFCMKTDGSQARRLSPNAGDMNFHRLSHDAALNQVAFCSNSDVVPGKNTDGNFEIFLLDVKRGKFRQLTFTEGGRGCFAPSMSADGKTVVFSSDRDLVPGMNTDGNDEVFLVEAPH